MYRHETKAVRAKSHSVFISKIMCGRRKCDASIVVALCAMCLMKAAADPTTPSAVAAAATTTTTTTTTMTTMTTVAGKYDDIAGNSELLKQVLTKKCLHRYTMTCLKLDVARLIDRLDTARTYQLLQGVSLVRATTTPDGVHNHSTGGHQHQQPHGGGIPAEVVRSLVRGNESAEELDGYLMEKMDAYLNSLSISVKLVDSTIVENVRKLSSQMLVNILPTELLETGRGKKNGMQMALWSAGTLAAIGFASLAAMSGKALMTAMLALALAVACALKGHQQSGHMSGKTSHYEIIAKPAAIYDHDHHVMHGASAYSSAPYSYARHLTAADDDGAGGPPYYAGGGRGHPQSPLLRVAVAGHAVAAAGPEQPPTEATTGVGDDNDGTNVGQSPYPLSPITYIPTNDD